MGGTRTVAIEAARHGAGRLRAVAVVAVAAAFFGPVSGVPRARAIDPWPGDASYSVPLRVLDAALRCRGTLDGRGIRQPVLLVHGTALNSKTTWSWNYERALPAAGFEVCSVELPSAALVDVQLSAEYAARAIEVMSAAAGERVDVVGHSQGGLVARWATRWFPAGALADDVVALAAPNHGTVLANLPTALRGCFESCWQMRAGSRFLDALNRADETPGTIAHTSIFSTSDEIVQPHTSARLRGASNVHVQSICPARPVDHMEMLADGLVYEVVRDALVRPGPARIARLHAEVCTRTLMPGTSAPPRGAAPDWRGGRIANREPALKPYARR